MEDDLRAAKNESLESLKSQILSMIEHKQGNEVGAKRYLEAFIKKLEEDYCYQIACVFAYHNDKDKAFYGWIKRSLL